MESVRLNLPTMYGDHHVVKVRQLISILTGVVDMRASAAQQQIVVTYDPTKITADAIASALSSGGYPPGEAPGAMAPADVDDLRHVAASDRAEAVPESKYQPPPTFGACPGLEMQAVAGEHPADRK